MIIDKSGEEGSQEGNEGKENDAEAAANSQANKNESESGGAADLDGGEKGGEAGKDAGAAEGAAGQEEGGEPEPVAFDPEKFQEAILEKVGAMMKPKEPEAPKELTDEQWADLEEKTAMPRASLQYMANTQAQIIDKIMDKMDEKYGGRLAQFETGSALSTLSKENGFSDASTHQKNVTDFLKDVDPRKHNDPEMLKKAVIYSRGLGMQGKINRVRNEGIKNLQIVGAGRPTSPGGTGAGKGSKPLDEAQRQVAEMMGGEAEYRKFMSTGNGPAIIGK